jgi:DNA-binding response OmpR family regulator
VAVEDNGIKGAESIVLIAEDDPEYLLLLVDSFKQMGHQVVSANGGHEAYWYLEKRRSELGTPRVTLVVSDWKMPEGDGVWLLHSIRSGPCREVPFLLISGAVSREELMGVAQMGADAVILKPFKFETLKAEATEAINRRQIKEAHKGLRG